MRRLSFRAALLFAGLLAGGCASRPLPKFEKPIARTRIQSVRTTAYTHTEADHLQHGRATALGTRLRSGTIHSAAADWSRWPAGTVFRIAETGEVYQVDDYGWALAGTNTIDLYKPSRAAMNAWGVRQVTIENLSWGDANRSLAVLRGRSKFRHVHRMIDEIEDRSSEFQPPVESTTVAQVAAPEPIAPRAEPVMRMAVGTAVTTGTRVGVAPLVPFRANVNR
jgi:3D (Asp-Asp-Asp) domain-containing protein